MGVLILEMSIALASACALALGLYGEAFPVGPNPALIVHGLLAALPWLAPCLAGVWILSWLIRRLRRAAGLPGERADGSRALRPLLAGFAALLQPVFTYFPLGFPLLILALAWIAGREFSAAACSEAGRAVRGKIEDRLQSWGMQKTALSAAALLFLLQITIIAGFWGSLPQPGGDEPHYLVISWSLMADGDLQLADDYKAREYHRWHEGWIQAHTKSGKGGSAEQYSMHNIGLALWLIPFLWVGIQLGTAGAIAFFTRLGMVVLATLLFHLFCRLLIRLGQNHLRALLITLLVGATVPYLFFSWHLFTEIPAALLTLAAFDLLWRTDSPSPARRIVLGLCISALPWLGVKYFALVLPLCLLWLAQERRWGIAPRIAWVAIPGLVLGLLFFWSTWQLFGTVSPSAYYLGADGNVLERNIVFKVTGARDPLEGVAIPAKTILAYFVDQREGLLFYAPWFLAALLAVPLLRGAGDDHRRLVFWLLVLAIPFILLYSLTGFGGGHSPPARALTPIAWIPVLALGCLPADKTRRLMPLLKPAIAISLLIALILLANPALLYHDFDVPASHLLTAFGSPLIDATKLFPSINNKFHEDGTVTALWCGVLVGLCAALFAPPVRALDRLKAIRFPALVAALLFWALLARTPPLSPLNFPLHDGTIYFQSGSVFVDKSAFWVKTGERETCFLVSTRKTARIPVRLRAVAPTVVVIESAGSARRLPLIEERVRTARIDLAGGFSIGGRELTRFHLTSLGGNPAGLDLGGGERRPLGVEVQPAALKPKTNP